MINPSLFILLFFIGPFLLLSCNSAPQQTDLIETLAVKVSPEENRQVAYTNKKDAYFYTRSHQYDRDWHAGLNVATKRIFHHYSVWTDGIIADASTAEVTVFPDKMNRRYADVVETLTMAEKARVLIIELSSETVETIGLSIDTVLVTPGSFSGDYLQFSPKEWPAASVVIAPIHPVKTQITNDGAGLTGPVSAGGFFVLFAMPGDSIKPVLNEARNGYAGWKTERRKRMNDLLAANFIKSNRPVFDKAYQWILINTDALITEQTGHGIYAGLPWFNDYWGRDTFISLPGASLVTGQTADARNILQSFGTYQNTEKSGKLYGRIPNRIRPDEVIYNTTDGTPRYVIALEDYINYTGDTSLVNELWPVVKRTIEGSIANWVDENGLLTHEDADTWMDAKKDGKIPYSPRGNRANDIQALWIGQLNAGIHFATMTGDTIHLSLWKEMVKKATDSFNRYYVDPVNHQMADRLEKSGQPDFSLRPNQFFAHHLVTDDLTRWTLIRKAWESLVYPWGVASLNQNDPNFHPYHEKWELYPANYHKDNAYHNGTVWVWNNGIAMQRLIESNQQNEAWKLQSLMAREAMVSDGAVGTLTECYDALPVANTEWPRKTGTFSQAWSNAEFLRVWSQYFIGLRPMAIEKTVIFEPKMPDSLSVLDHRVPMIGGHFNLSYRKSDGQEKWVLEPTGLNVQPITITSRFTGYVDMPAVMYDNEQLMIIKTDEDVRLQLLDTTGEVRAESVGKPDPGLMEKALLQEQIMNGIQFCEPYLNPDLNVLQLLKSQ